MKYIKLLNLIPLPMFILIFLCGGEVISVWPMIVVLILGIMNVVSGKDMKQFLISSLLLFLSSVGGVILFTYYYYYMVSSDFETPIVGAFIAIVYAIFVALLFGIGAVIALIRNRKKV